MTVAAQLSPESRGRAGGLASLVLTGGIASLGTEIAVARLVAPHFGGSTVVWSNTIAVVLLSLSCGYWLGGRLADRHPDERALRFTLLGASVLLALIPFAARAFFTAAEDGLELGPFAGSLLVVATLAAFPLVLVGTASPWTIRLAVVSIEDAGRTSGRLYAISTAGSLIGVFVAALVLLPAVGTQRTFVAFSFLLAAISAVGLPRWVLLVPAALAGLLAVPPLPTS
jgi:predicted membrane-bound spermidine synthase